MKIVIVEHQSGDHPKIEAHGFQGPLCEKAIKAVRDSLGGTVVSSRKKPEYYQGIKAGQKNLS